MKKLLLSKLVRVKLMLNSIPSIRGSLRVNF